MLPRRVRYRLDLPDIRHTATQRRKNYAGKLALRHRVRGGGESRRVGPSFRAQDHLQAGIPQISEKVHRLRSGEDQRQGNLVLVFPVFLILLTTDFITYRFYV